VVGPSSSHVTSADMSRFLMIVMILICDKWVPVTMAWRVLRLRMKEQPPMWRVAMNILNKQLRTADKLWSSSLGLGEVLTTPHCKNVSCCEAVKE
jgi:hypothetical protein